MKVFVTGAAGFVGSRSARKLLDRGDEVVGHDNFDPYYAREHKERHLRDLRGAKGFEFIEGDLRDESGMLGIFRGHRFDAVAHMAAMAAVRYSMLHPLVYGQTNVQGTMNLLDAARQTSNPRFVLASTGSVYGTSTPVPFREDAAADRPLAPYPASKRAMELMAHCYHHLWKMPVTVVRFFNVYGPQGRPDMMPWQWTLDILRGKALTLYNGGRIKRDWTYIDDIVAGLVLALDNPPHNADGTAGYDILNLGCSNPVENLRFVEVLEGVLGKKALIVDTPTPPTEPLITHADISKARRVLGYEPKVMVEEGLKRFVEWMRDERIIQ